MNPEALSQSRNLLLSCTHPLLVTHIAPDGDAVGSLLGMGWALRALGKEPTLSCQDAIPQRFGFLAGTNQITSNPTGAFDLLICLDCSDPFRMGSIGDLAGVDSLPLLNVDHHVTNLQFGMVNLVDVAAVSTTHILYQLFRYLEIPIDERIAGPLLTGLVTDTRSFRTSNVTAEVLQIAIELMQAGAPLTTITFRTLDQRSLPTIKLWGIALSRLEAADGVVWTSVPIAVQRAVGLNSYASSGLSNLLIGAQEVVASAVFTEREDGQIEVGFRAVPGFDVSRIALSLGGGGHALASGCLVPGPLEEAQEQVLSLLREDVARQLEQAAAGNERHPQP
ncbi:MAG: bifunctional oligoribonuclease/PAP phosphatase NrnA [Anaerolineae bacterium]|nr:bifunctional oligoribonuclease/PAP phosphatase NrnA [Anaerolineae bacterium]